MLPPLTEEKLPPAVLFSPPLTEAMFPLAVFTDPPLTEEIPPLAVLSAPPLTEDALLGPNPTLVSPAANSILLSR